MNTSEPHVVTDGANKRIPIDAPLESLLLRQRGPNAPLVREVLSGLSPSARQRLYRILYDLQAEVNDGERRLRRRLRGSRF